MEESKDGKMLYADENDPFSSNNNRAPQKEPSLPEQFGQMNFNAPLAASEVDAA